MSDAQPYDNGGLVSTKHWHIMQPGEVIVTRHWRVYELTETGLVSRGAVPMPLRDSKPHS